MRRLFFALAMAFAPFARADVFQDVAAIEALDAVDTSEYVSPVLFLGEQNPRFELVPALRPRLDELNFRARYHDAWQMYKRSEISEFSYFGFKLQEVKDGALPLEKFLRELQQSIERWK